MQRKPRDDQRVHQADEDGQGQNEQQDSGQEKQLAVDILHAVGVAGAGLESPFPFLGKGVVLGIAVVHVDQFESLVAHVADAQRGHPGVSGVQEPLLKKVEERPHNKKAQHDDEQFPAGGIFPAQQADDEARQQHARQRLQHREEGVQRVDAKQGFVQRGGVSQQPADGVHLLLRHSIPHMFSSAPACFMPPGLMPECLCRLFFLRQFPAHQHPHGGGHHQPAGPAAGIAQGVKALDVGAQFTVHFDAVGIELQFRRVQQRFR